MFEKSFSVTINALPLSVVGPVVAIVIDVGSVVDDVKTLEYPEYIPPSSPVVVVYDVIGFPVNEEYVFTDRVLLNDGVPPIAELSVFAISAVGRNVPTFKFDVKLDSIPVHPVEVF